MTLPVLPALPAEGIDGEGAGGQSNPNPPIVPVGAADPFPAAAGDIWRVELRWELDQAVNASSLLFYRQIDDAPVGVDPAEYLGQLLILFADTPVHKWLLNVANTCEVVCLVIRNVSQSNDFTRVINISNRKGRGGPDMLSSQLSTPMRIQSSDGNRKHRKTIYWPGLEEPREEDGKIAAASFAMLAAAFDDFLLLTDDAAGGSGIDYFHLQYGKVADTWFDAGGIHPGCYLTRQYGRLAAVC